jgi:methyl coenzyme M reductase gamma subunit
MTMKLVVTYGCVSMGKHLYRTGDSFELPDDEAEKLMERADEQVVALVGNKVAPANEQETEEPPADEPEMELPQADAAAAVQK